MSMSTTRPKALRLPGPPLPVMLATEHAQKTDTKAKENVSECRNNRSVTVGAKSSSVSKGGANQLITRDSDTDSDPDTVNQARHRRATEGSRSKHFGTNSNIFRMIGRKLSGKPMQTIDNSSLPQQKSTDQSTGLKTDKLKQVYGTYNPSNSTMLRARNRHTRPFQSTSIRRAHSNSSETHRTSRSSRIISDEFQNDILERVGTAPSRLSVSEDVSHTDSSIGNDTRTQS